MTKVNEMLAALSEDVIVQGRGVYANSWFDLELPEALEAITQAIVEDDGPDVVMVSAESFVLLNDFYEVVLRENLPPTRQNIIDQHTKARPQRKLRPAPLQGTCRCSPENRLGGTAYSNEITTKATKVTP